MPIAATRLRPARELFFGGTSDWPGCPLPLTAGVAASGACGGCEAGPTRRAPTARFGAVEAAALPSSGSVMTTGLPSRSLVKPQLGVAPGTGSNLQQLGFLVLDQLVDVGHVSRGQFVELALRPADVVLARLAVLGELVEGVLGVAAHGADRHLGVLALVPGDL